MKEKTSQDKSSLLVSILSGFLVLTLAAFLTVLFTEGNQVLPIFACYLGGAGSLASFYGVYSHHRMVRLGLR